MTLPSEAALVQCAFTSTLYLYPSPLNPSTLNPSASTSARALVQSALERSRCGRGSCAALEQRASALRSLEQ
jgi:hypothetical protein